MKIYLAANYSRHPEMRDIRKICNERGHEVVSRWIEGNHEILEGKSHDLNTTFAQEDYDDLSSSSIVLWFSNETKEIRGRGGRHVEFGMAIAWNIEIFVIGRKENVFHYLSQIRHFDTLEEALNAISELDYKEEL